jgi:hypothetical protein
MSTVEEANDYFESKQAQANMKDHRDAIPALCKRKGCNLPEADLIHHKDELRRREIAAGFDDELSRSCHNFEE